MTPELLLELARLPMFPRTAAELIRVAGLEAAAGLIAAWPGQEFPIPKVVGGGNRHGERRWEQLVEIVGEVAAKRIVAWGPGSKLCIPNCKEVIWADAQDKIRTEYDGLITQGYSSPEAVFELGIKWRVTGTTVENIVKRPNNVKAEPPVQASLF